MQDHIISFFLIRYPYYYKLYQNFHSVLFRKEIFRYLKTIPDDFFNLTISYVLLLVDVINKFSSKLYGTLVAETHFKIFNLILGKLVDFFVIREQNYSFISQIEN